MSAIWVDGRCYNRVPAADGRTALVPPRMFVAEAAPGAEYEVPRTAQDVAYFRWLDAAPSDALAWEEFPEGADGADRSQDSD